MRKRLSNHWQSKHWFMMLIVLLSLLKVSEIYDYVWLNLMTVHLNHILQAPIYQIPTIISESDNIDHFLDYTPFSSHGNVKALIYQTQGYMAMLNGSEQEALSLWQKASADKQRFVRNNELAHEADLFDSSLQWARWGQELQPDIGDWAYYQAITYSQLRKFEVALSHLESSLEKPLEDVGRSDIYYLIGSNWTQQAGSTASKNAVTNFESAISLNEFKYPANRIAAHFDLAEIYRVQEREKEAIVNYIWVVEQDPNHYSANLWLGSLYWIAEGNVDQARFYLERAIMLEPGRKWAYRNLAMVLQGTNELEDAIKLYEQVLAIDPNDNYVKHQLEILGIK